MKKQCHGNNEGFWHGFLARRKLFLREKGGGGRVKIPLLESTRGWK